MPREWADVVLHRAGTGRETKDGRAGQPDPHRRLTQTGGLAIVEPWPPRVARHRVRFFHTIPAQ